MVLSWEEESDYLGTKNFELPQKSPFGLCLRPKLGFFKIFNLRFITDVGTSYFLSRLRNGIGMFLGLTAHSLKG